MVLDWPSETVLAEDGEEAVASFQNDEPELILLDTDLPDADCYDTVKRMRTLDPSWRPILFLSEDAESEDYVDGIKAGGDDYLIMPVDKEILQAKLIAMERILAMRKQLIAVTAEMAWENEKAQLIAHQDGLTGLANRRYLNENSLAYVPDWGVYTESVDWEGRPFYAVLSRQMVLFCIERRKAWRLLQSKAGIANKDYRAQRALLEQLNAGELSRDDVYARGRDLLAEHQGKATAK